MKWIAAALVVLALAVAGTAVLAIQVFGKDDCVVSESRFVENRC